MPLERAQSVLLKHFALTRTCSLPAGEGALVTTPLVAYLSAPVLDGPIALAVRERITFPVVRTREGAPWAEACLYLVHKLFVDQVQVSTCVSLSKDLALYRRYLDESGCDFRYFPESTFERVTYRYKGHLKIQVNSGALGLKTARRKMSSVISFYRWMIFHGIFKPANIPWREREILIQIDGDYRGNGRRKVITTDLAFKDVTEIDHSIITDGGRLRPISSDNQMEIIRALDALNNPEMYFSHLLALFSGARIQTVLTMRRDEIIGCVRGPNNCAHIKVGAGTGIDTKKNKKYVLVVPWDLIERLRVYVGSERATKRLAISKGGRFKEKEYLFLTNRGEPYYKSIQDPGYDEKRYRSEGAAIRQFINDRVRPLLSGCVDDGFSYRFHDLRASFVMNLYSSLSKLLLKGEITDIYLREYLRFRLGQSSKKSLESYMKFISVNEIADKAQWDWEKHLVRMLNGG